MNKTDLVEMLVNKKNLQDSVANNVIAAVFDSMADALLAGDRIEVRGFGSFAVKEYAAYTGRNPKISETAPVKAKKVATFRVVKDLKSRISS